MKVVIIKRNHFMFWIKTMEIVMVIFIIKKLLQKINVMIIPQKKILKIIHHLNIK